MQVPLCMLQVPGTFTHSSLRTHLRVGTSFAEGLSASKITLVSRYEELTMPVYRLKSAGGTPCRSGIHP
jgi:hypothetical protein